MKKILNLKPQAKPKSLSRSGMRNWSNLLSKVLNKSKPKSVLSQRPRRLVIEQLEPRMMLSGEAMILPPQQQQQDASMVIDMTSSAIAGAVQADNRQWSVLDENINIDNETSEQEINEIIFIDPSVEDKESLLTQALSYRHGTQAEVVVLDAESDGLQQITSWLKQYQNLDSVHIISHGQPGSVTLGSATLSEESLDGYESALSSWSKALNNNADILFYGCELAVNESGNSLVERIAELTGADVAASDDATGSAQLGGDWVLERQTGMIDVAALMAQDYVHVLTNEVTASILELNAALQTQLNTLIEKLDALATEAIKDDVLVNSLPGLGQSVNALIGIGDAPANFLGLSAAATTYLNGGAAKTLTGLDDALTTALNSALTTIKGSTDQNWVVALTPRYNPIDRVVGFNLTIDLDWTKTSPSVTGYGTWAGNAEVDFHFNADVGMVLTQVSGTDIGSNNPLNTATMENLTTPSNANSFIQLNQLDVGLTLTPTTASASQFSLLAGISAKVADPNNADGLTRLTLSEWTTATAALDITQKAMVSGFNGTDGYFGSLSGAGVLSVTTFVDTALTGAVGTNFKQVFTAANTLTDRINALDALGVTLPMADVSLAGLLTMNDGRSLSDVLSFRTPANTSVLDDYLVDAGSSAKLSGLISYIQQYLSGTGVYDHLEALLPPHALASMMSIRDTRYTGSYIELSLDLSLVREFNARFMFDDAFKGLGFSWLPGDGVPLLAHIDYDTVWSFNTATPSSSTIDINGLSFKVENASDSVDAAVILGVLDARAQGSVVFETSEVTVAVNTGNAFAISSASAATLTPSVAPTVKAGGYLEFVGNIAGTDFTTFVTPVTVTDTTSAELVVKVFGQTANAPTAAVLNVEKPTVTIQELVLASGDTNTSATLSGFSPTENGLTVKLYNAGNTLISTYTVANGLTYDAATKAWSVTTTDTLEAGTYSIEVSISFVNPRISFDFGSNIAPVTFANVETTTLTTSERGLDQLRKFFSLDSVTLSNMMTDLGTYLQMLRDSGEFDALLPYTNLTLGQALDFSAIINQITDDELAMVQSSGIAASGIISPVLTQDTSFDIQFAREGDTRNSLITVTILASETTGFTHIDQLAQLLDRKIATSYGGALAWQTQSGTLPTTALADVSVTQQGGLIIASQQYSNSIQRIDLHASSGAFQLGYNGAQTGALTVFATATEVQNALASLVGEGNVVVTGTPKHYVVEFMGQLAGKSVADLDVTLSSNATVGGALDVVASYLVAEDGVVKGRLNILEAMPDSFTTLTVAPSAGISIQNIVDGKTTGTGDATEKTAAVQRLVIANAVSGTFTLSGKKVDNTAFTTAAINLDEPGQWSTRIQSALNTALGLDASTGVKVTVTDPEILVTNQGTQSFDISFEGTTVKGLSFDLLVIATSTETEVEILGVMVDNPNVIKSKPSVQSGSFVLKQATPLLGETAATGEVQQLYLHNLTWGEGSFYLGLAINGQTLSSESISLTGKTAAQVAADIQTQLFSMLRLSDATLNDTGIVNVTVASEDASTGSYAFKISYGSQLAGKDMPQLMISTAGLTPKTSTNGYHNLTVAGFSSGGQDSQQTKVTTFNTLNDLVARFQQAVNDNLTGASFSVNPRFDAATSSFMFDVKFLPDAQLQSVAMQVPSSIGDLSGFDAQANLVLSTQALFEGTVGFDFSKLNTFALTASGVYEGSLRGLEAVSAGHVSSINLLGTSFTLTMGKKADGSDATYTIAIPNGQAFTHDTLLTKIQDLLDATATITDDDLDKRGFDNLGQAVTAQWRTSGDQKFLDLVVRASISSAEISAVALLGYSDVSSTTPVPTALALPSDGKLTANATFSVQIDATTAVSLTVTAASTITNTSRIDLLADINDALAAFSISAHTYLGTGADGLGFSDLADVIQAYMTAEGRLQFITVTPKVGNLSIAVTSETNSAYTQLGLINGQDARTSGADVFLQNVTLGGDWSAVVQDQTSNPATTLAQAGSASIGMLDINFDTLSTDYQGSVRFELRKDSTQTTSSNNDVRLSLNNDLFNAVSGQTAQLGMGGDISTSSSSVVSGEPVLSNGQLLRDIGLTVIIEGAGVDGADLTLDVVVTKASTSTNASLNDLAIDIDAAIQTAVSAANVTVTVPSFTAGDTSTTSGTTYKATNGFVGVYKFIDDKDTTPTTDDTTTYHLEFFAPTIGESVKTLTVKERLLVKNTITDLVFDKNTGEAGTNKTAPTASLVFSNMAIDAPSSLSSVATVVPNSTLTVSVTNMAQMLAGEAATTSVVVVPSNGLGVLTPLTEVDWLGVAEQFSTLPELFGSLSGFGSYNELGRNLPFLNQSLSSLFDLGDRFQLISDYLASLDGSLQGVVSSVGFVDADDLTEDAHFSLSFNDEEAYSFTVVAAGVTTEADLMTDINTLLAFQEVVADSALAKLGFSKVGQAVEAILDRTTGQIQFVVRAAVETMTVSAVADTLGGEVASSRFVTQLGFSETTTVKPSNNNVSLSSLQQVLSSAFDSQGVTLTYDNTSGKEALRFTVPYTLQLNDQIPLALLLDDSFTKLLSAEDKEKLTALTESITGIVDSQGNSPLNVVSSIFLQLDFGLDLTDSKLGQLFLYDHTDVGTNNNLATNTGFTDDTGTFARISVDIDASGLAFDSDAGIMKLRISGGEVDLAVDALLSVDNKTQVNSIELDRIYLADYETQYDESTTSGATRAQVSELQDYRSEHFDVSFIGSASANLPMALVLSDDLGQLAIENIEGFINPMPLGTFAFAIPDLHKVFQVSQDQTLHTDMATVAFDANNLVIQYGTGSATVVLAGLAATTGNITDNQIKVAIAEAIAVLMKGDRSTWNDVDYASMVGVTGTRATGYDVQLTGALATAYNTDKLTKTLSMTLTEANGQIRGSFTAPVIASTTEASVTTYTVSTSGPSVSEGVYKSQELTLSVKNGATTVASKTLSIGQSDALDGLVSTAAIQRAMSDAALDLIVSDTFTSTISGIKVSSLGETIYFNYRDSKANIKLTADTEDDAADIKDAVSRVLTGSTDSASLVTVSGQRSGFTITLSGALAQQHAGELRVKTADGTYKRAELVTTSGNRATGFETALSSSVANQLGSNQLSAVVKDVTHATTPTDTSSGSVTVSGVVLTNAAQTIVFSYPGKDSIKLSIAPTGAGYGLDTDAEIKSAIQSSVSSLLTTSASLGSLVQVTGDRVTGFTITLTGSLASGYTGAIKVDVFAHTVDNTSAMEYIRIGGDTLNDFVAEAAKPATASSESSGSGDSGVEGAPLDVDIEDQLNSTNTNPYNNLTGGVGSTTSPSASALPEIERPGANAPTTQPTTSGYDISYVLPDLGGWQNAVVEVIQSAGGVSCDPEKLDYFPVIFLLRDPTILVESLDTVFAGMQTSLEAVVSGLGKLPLVGDQLVDLTGAGSALDFIVDLRANVTGALLEALSSTIKVYGGLDNAIRMMLFDFLTTDTNGDWVIDGDDEGHADYNQFLNFVHDYNGDDLVTPDDIVIEYLIGEDQDISKIALPPGVQIDAFDAGQRAFWVSSGLNAPIGNMTSVTTSGATHTATLTVQPVNYGGYTLGFTIGDGDAVEVFESEAIAPDADAATIQAAIEQVLAAASEAYLASLPDGATIPTLANIVSVEQDEDDATQFVITISGGELPAGFVFSVVDACYTTEAGKLILDASMENIIASTYAQEASVIGDPVGVMTGSGSSYTLTMAGDATWGEVNLGFTYTVDGAEKTFETVGIPYNASAAFVQQALQNLLDNIRDEYASDRSINVSTIAETVTVTKNGNAFTITFSEGELPGSFSRSFTDYTDFNRNTFLRDVLKATSAVQFRMNLGLSYHVDLDISFDVGVDGLPLYLTTSGGLALDITWETYVGFGVDIKDGFFLNVNMPNTAGIGSVTTLDDNGIAIGTEANEGDTQFSFMFAVGKMDSTLLKLGMFDAFMEHPEEVNFYKYLRTDEVVLSLDFTLAGTDTDGDGEEDRPFSAEGQLLFLNAQIKDDWSGYVKDNTGAFWGDISQTNEDLWVKAEKDGSNWIIPDNVYVNESGQTVNDPSYDLDYRELNADNGGNLFTIDNDGYLRYARAYTIGNGGEAITYLAGDHVQKRQPNGRPLPDVTPLGTRLLADNTGKDGSRTHLYVEFALDIMDPGAAGSIFGEVSNDSGAYKNNSTTSSSGGAAVGSSLGLEETSVENGRLTFAKLKGQALSDLVEAKAQVRAQLNLIAEFGIGLDGSGSLPSVQGGFHLLWGKETSSSTSEDKSSKWSAFNPQYDKLFTEDSPSIWLTDIALDLGTWASNFMIPVAKTIQDVIGPFQPIIDLLTSPIPGISDIMGREYSVLDLASDLSKTFGGDAKIDFIIAMVRLAAVITKIPTDAKNLIIPVTDVLILSGTASRQYNLAPVKSVLANIDPSGTTTSLGSGFQNLGNAMKKPGNKFTIPLFEKPFETTINLLLGKPADLILFQPPGLEVAVGFRLSFPVFPPLYVGLGGEIKLQANLTLGFDTFGIMQSLDTGNWLNVVNGFYVSDNVINGIDVPEVILTTKLYAFAELNGGIIRGGVEGGIKFVGTLDLCDPDKDGKVRTNEIISAISENPLDLVAANLKASAYISAYLDIFALVKYVRVFEYTFMDVTMFSWEFNPCDKKPVLAVMDGSVLVFNTGSGTGEIDGNPAITQQAKDRLRKDVTDGDEKYTLTDANGGIKITAILPNGKEYDQTFGAGITKVHGFAGAGNDIFDASAISTAVYFVAGSGTDVLIGGSGDDILIGSTSGTATLEGRLGNDKLIARGGTTTMLGVAGNDTYRFLGDWGTAKLFEGSATDGLGENTLDFSAQTKDVRIDDYASKAIQGSSTATWLAGDVLGGTSIDEVKGGLGNDYLDFSGRDANLLVTLTDTNAGWVTNGATGDNTTSTFTKTPIQTIGAHGFRFVGVENVIGGKGSDVFYVHNGASVTGSLIGDTTGGLHQGAELTNARNTIDFSNYTTAVSVNQESTSAFGNAGAKNIMVRGMHNMIGGSAGDTLIGDGRQNLIVGNGGADILEGRAGHDMLVADTFITWQNEINRPSSLIAVDSYITLQTAGTNGGFGADGRRWIWLGQSIENQSLTTAGQTLKGGGGNDVIFGALGGDTINVGGTAEGNDTIIADLGRVAVDFFFRSALRASTLGSSGGNDRIYLGTGNNIVLAGLGDDSITGIDTKNSMNIVLTDVGDVKFRTTSSTDDQYVTGSPAGKLTFATAGGSNHALEYVTTETITATQAFKGGNDTVNMTSGSAIVLGGAGDDAISFSAVSSIGSNVRWIAGDHARIDADVNGGVTRFTTLDINSATGGMDTIRIGDGADADTRNLGSNYLLGGMGSDSILVSAHYDAQRNLVRGEATSQDVIIGDNGEVARTTSISASSTPNLMLQAKTIVNDKGADDEIITGNGGKVVLGGFGSDTIGALDGVNLVFGDNAEINYDSIAKNGILREVKATDLVIGGNDTITLREGYKLVNGGIGNDTIAIDATTTPEAKGIAIANGILQGVTGVGAVTGEGVSVEETEAKGRTGRFVTGDNATFTFDNKGGLTDMITSDQISATGGADVITLGAQNTTANLGYQVVFGGMGADKITVQSGSLSEDIIFGDNASLNRAMYLYETITAESTVLSSGDDDEIVTGSGNKIVVAGFGNDLVNVNTIKDTDRVNRSILLGDSGGLYFDAGGAGALQSVISLGLDFGGNDSVTVRDGDVAFIGGSANDSLIVDSSENAFRTVVGDNARLTFSEIADVSLQSERLTGILTIDQVSSTGGNDNLSIGVASAADLGRVYVVGGMGGDTITISAVKADVVMAGDNVRILRNADVDDLTQGQLSSVLSLLPDQGAADTLVTTSGQYTLVGGMGGDTIQAGKGEGVVFGDSATLEFNGQGKITSAVSLGNAQGGNDTILLGIGSATYDGNKVVVGGFGSDNITVQALSGTVDQPLERQIAGDNVSMSLNSGNLINFATQDSNTATAGNDTIVLNIAGSASNGVLTDYHVVAGGLGADSISVSASTSTSDVVSGDNLEYTRGRDIEDVRQHVYAGVTQTYAGGDDTIRVGAGEKVLMGGAGNDAIISLTAANQNNRNIAFGDSGNIVFDNTGSGKLSQIISTSESIGGNDRLSLGGGQIFALGGFGVDTLMLGGADNSIRVLFGDNGQINFQSGEASLAQTSGSDSVLSSAVVDTFSLPNTGTNFVLGGPGQDIRSGSTEDVHRLLPGSGSINLITKVISVVVLGNNTDLGVLYNGTYKSGVSDAISRAGTDFVLAPTTGGGASTGGSSSGSTNTITLITKGTGSVTEDTTNSVVGRIAYPALEGGIATFNSVANSQQGVYGYLTMGEDGSWAYRLGEAATVGTVDATVNARVQALKTGEVKTEVFTVRTSDGSATTVTISVAGKTDHPENASGSVREDEDQVLTTNGVITDVDSVRGSYQAITNKLGIYGTFNLTANGEWIYTLNNTAPNVQALKTSDVVSDSFSVTSADGSESQVSVTITGSDDAASIVFKQSSPSTSDFVASTYADTSSVDTFSSQSGVVSVASVDANRLLGYSVNGQTVSSVETEIEGEFGKLVWNTSTGAFTYVPDANKINRLASGGASDDFEFVVTSGVEETTTTLSFSITGSAIETDTIQGLVENKANALTGSVAGAVTLVGGSTVNNVQSMTLAGGVFSINNQGAYTFVKNTTVEQQLPAGQTLSNIVTLVVDGVEHYFDFKLTGTNDLAVINDTVSLGITSTAENVTGTLSTTGSLSITDADTGEAKFDTLNIISADGNLGSLSITDVGSWTYTVANSATQSLKAGETKTETFTVKSLDGQTSKNIVVILTGTNNTAVIGGTVSSGVTSAAETVTGNLSTAGSLNITDADAGENKFQTTVISADGNLGSLIITDAGEWTYTVANSATQYLKANATKTETFTVKSFDGLTSRDIVVTLTGANNTPIISGVFVGSVQEDTTLLSQGSVLAVDADAGESAWQAGIQNSIYGQLRLLANGQWIYTLNNNSQAVQVLNLGESKQDTYTVLTSDGMMRTITITLEGKSEPVSAVSPSFVSNVNVNQTSVNNNSNGVITASTGMNANNLTSPVSSTVDLGGNRDNVNATSQTTVVTNMTGGASMFFQPLSTSNSVTPSQVSNPSMPFGMGVGLGGLGNGGLMLNGLNSNVVVSSMNMNGINVDSAGGIRLGDIQGITSKDDKRVGGSKAQDAPPVSPTNENSTAPATEAVPQQQNVAPVSPQSQISNDSVEAVIANNDQQDVLQDTAALEAAAQLVALMTRPGRILWGVGV